MSFVWVRSSEGFFTVGSDLSELDLNCKLNSIGGFNENDLVTGGTR